MRPSVRALRLVLVLTELAAMVVSCGPYRVEYLEDSLRQMTQTELIHKFGYPQRLKRLKNGATVWEYDFQASEAECTSYAITFDAEEQLRGWERYECHPGNGIETPRQ